MNRYFQIERIARIFHLPTHILTRTRPPYKRNKHRGYGR